jgi:DNA polymerase III epsilon subunit-like protein
MKIIIFDTETTGLPKSKLISEEVFELWPNIVQFSYIIYDTQSGDILKVLDKIIKLENTLISEESSKIHGITNAISLEKGIDLELIINEFFEDIKNVDLIIGHNILFDLNVLKIELMRLKKINEQKYLNYLDVINTKKNFYCTMQESIELCNIEVLNKKGEKYIKFPKLSELYIKLFNEVPNNLHNSLIDVIITLRCFMKLKLNVDIFINKTQSDIEKIVENYI